MNHNDLVQQIRSFGAFVPYKFRGLFSEEKETLGEEIFRKYPHDISLSTGGLYVAMPLPPGQYWAGLVKEHFRNLSGIRPKNGLEMNNMAFAYDTFGFYRDPSDRNEKWTRIIDNFGIGSFRELQPMYEDAIRLDQSLWEPRYNIADGLLRLWVWGDKPEDTAYFERAFEELNAVLEINPENIPARLDLAGTFHDFVNPYELYSEVLEIDPDNEEAKSRLVLLNNL